MATIKQRTNKNGLLVWRVLFRRKNIPHFCATFFSQEEAEKFAKEEEPKYVACNGVYDYDHLKARRDREFTR